MLHRIITLPERISSDKFIKYTTNYAFLWLQTGQLDYILLSESDFDKCCKGDVVVCPVNMAVYSVQSLTCEVSLYFQAASHYRLCKRKLLLHSQIPTLQRHGTLWTYYFPTRQQVAINCPAAVDHSPRALSLHGNGLLHNASSCRISTRDVQIIPELRGTTQTELSTLKLYVPEKVPIIADPEVRQLADMALTTEIQKLDNIYSRFITHRQTLDLDTLLHVHHVSQVQQAQPHWHTFVATSVSIAVILGLLHLYLRPYPRIIHCSPPKTDAPSHTASPQDPEPQQQTPELLEGNSKQSIVFTSYPFKQTDCHNARRTSSGYSHESCLQLLMSLHFPRTARTAMDFHPEVELMIKDYNVCVLPCIDECSHIICEMFSIFLFVRDIVYLLLY
jgi:hypothetical protein